MEQRPDPYQHWLDDAANMGLMLFRMRHDSKRERLIPSRPGSPMGFPPGSPQQARAGPNQRPTGGGSASGNAPPAPRSGHRHPHDGRPGVPPAPNTPPALQPLALVDNATPRTSRALQTPTVATESSHHSTQPSGSHYYEI